MIPQVLPRSLRQRLLDDTYPLRLVPVVQSPVYWYILGWLEAGDKGATANVKQGYGGPNGSLGKYLVLEGDAHELAVEGKGQRAELHVEEHPEDTLLLEGAAVGLTH